MKKIYIPTKEELLLIDSYNNVNTYKYLLVKVVEKLLANYKYINTMDNNLKDNKELCDSICYIYPEEINHSNNYDKDLCSRILDKHPSKQVYNLDNLARFNNDVLNDFGIILKTIDLLSKGLKTNPEYRFNYKDNILLDSIFNVEYARFTNYLDIYINKLIEIDPTYALYLPNKTMVEDNIRLAVAIDEYSDRYGIPYLIGREYLNKDIINKPDEKVKKLINYLYK